MRLAEALSVIIPLLRDELVVHANGFISRESFNINDRPGNFYMIGSMGLASSIALGVALNKPERRVVVFDGDGNILMNLGSLAMISATQPRNLVHVVFDNEVYGSTGNQRTIAGQVALEEVARAAGYRTVQRVDAETELRVVAAEFLSQPGPSFLLIKIESDKEERKIGRITHEPPQIAARFMRSIGTIGSVESIESNSMKTQETQETQRTQ
jgi:phosphonopyruvate decarboxylase/sulfopyruvate decarboxylase subunit beta